MTFFVKHCQFALEIVDYQSLKALPIWRFLDHFSLEKILRSTRTLDCDKYRLKLKGRFFSFCWAIFLYFSTPTCISWVMKRNVINSTFCGHCAALDAVWLFYIYFRWSLLIKFTKFSCHCLIDIHHFPFTFPLLICCVTFIPSLFRFIHSITWLFSSSPLLHNHPSSPISPNLHLFLLVYLMN